MVVFRCQLQQLFIFLQTSKYDKDERVSSDADSSNDDSSAERWQDTRQRQWCAMLSFIGDYGKRRNLFEEEYDDADYEYDDAS